ncbi:MAG: class I SAM-dependent methyltransferase [Geminocystis sp.]|nr:class I SAM-dependent methyltransferase [Geminocystis sp.]MCX8078082.1 class I SAM-dependent methyltransferase [Geminocystis sp.]MDW8116480.1 class I SAM-dependent methyltransferase [Geminocystis sp.]
MERILEPEVMDDPQEAEEYDSMDFTEVNTDFALLASKLGDKSFKKVLDLGTGTARIPIILASFRPQWQIVAVDLAASMLAIAERNIRAAGKSSQIILQLADAKNLPYPDNSFDIIISNSLVHHIPNPLDLFQEINRLVKPTGGILIRDLVRPNCEAEIDKIVAEANLDYTPRQKQLFRNSLYAALTVDEIKSLAAGVGWHNAEIYQSSPRHWTLLCSLS